MEPLLPFREALKVWWQVGLQSFGGPAGQVAVMHKLLVEERRWIGETRFLHALNYCMLLPGPEAMQLATYLGWLLHGTRGGLAAGALFILPGFLTMLALSAFYVLAQGQPLALALFFGLKAAVLSVVVEAVLRIGKKVLKNTAMVVLAALSFLAIYAYGAPFPLIVAGAGLAGLIGGWLRPSAFAVLTQKSADGADQALVDGLLAADPQRLRPSAARALRTVAIGLALWFVPIALLAAFLGPSHIYVEEGLFFSKAATVTFGGAYAVLAYLAQQAVERYGWVQPGEMVDGLGLAESTPGPLILVVQFVGFLAAYRDPGSLPPLLAGLLGALVTVWVTFVPCYLWIFLGAPYIERLRGHRGLTHALSAITAAVVGVVANLALFFGLHVLFASLDSLPGPLASSWLWPNWSTLDLPAAVIALGAAIALLRFHHNLLWVLASAMILGMAAHWLGLT